MTRNRPPACLVLACIGLVSAACVAVSGGTAPVTLRVFAAASLGDAFGELGREFEASHPGVKVEFNYAGSQQLSQQLAQGATADVFASANARQMEVVQDAGRVAAGASQPFARNRLVVIYPSDGPTMTGLSDLARPGLRLVLAAAEVPVGQYSMDFLDKAAATPELGSGFRDAVAANVVSYEENVKAVLAKVSLGEADAGVVYASDLAGATSDLAGADADKVRRLDIPDALNVIAEYPIAPVADSEQPSDAADFVEWVLSEQGQAILAKYGFIPITEP